MVLNTDLKVNLKFKWCSSGGMAKCIGIWDSRVNLESFLKSLIEKITRGLPHNINHICPLHHLTIPNPSKFAASFVAGDHDGSLLEEYFLHRGHWRPFGHHGTPANYASRRRRAAGDWIHAQDDLSRFRERGGNSHLSYTCQKSPTLPTC